MDSCCNCGRFLPWDAQESGRSHSSTKILLSLRSLSTEVFSWKSDLCTFANVLWPSNIIWLYHLSSSCHGGLHGSFNIMIGWNASLLPHHRCHLWKLARMHQRAKPCLDSIFWRSTLSVIGRQNEPNLTVLLICTPVYTQEGVCNFMWCTWTQCYWLCAGFCSSILKQVVARSATSRTGHIHTCSWLEWDVGLLWLEGKHTVV